MPRSFLRAVLVAAGLASSLASFVPQAAAACCLEAMTDADEVDGKLDLRRLRYEKEGANAPVGIKVRTYEAWGPAVLQGNENRLKVLFDSDDDGAADYRARIRRVVGTWAVYMDGVGEHEGEQFETLEARKPNARTVVFTIPGGAPMNEAGTLEMRAVSRFTESVECDPGSGSTACVDRVPNAGWL